MTTTSQASRRGSAPPCADVTIIGAGIAGAAAAYLLAQRGLAVQVLEARADPRVASVDDRRSINLALSARGLRALARLDALDALARELMPMRARLVHTGHREARYPYDLISSGAIYSVRRGALARALLERARLHPRVRLVFERRCARAELARRRLWLAGGGGRSMQPFRALIGADSARSSVRDAQAREGGATSACGVHPHAYKELAITAARARARRLAPDALHIWPGGDCMLIALPNADGSFTATLFLPAEAAEAGHCARLLASRFADAFDLFGDLDAQLAAHPLGRTHTVRCAPWHGPGPSLVLGDAAHAMAPFFGQGANAALEDCLVLDECVGEARGDLGAAFALAFARRKRDADAICELSEDNYAEMRSGVAARDYALTRAMEAALQRLAPERYLPLYAMVSFTTMPYAVARARGAIQAAIVDELLARYGTPDAVEPCHARAVVERRLAPLPGAAARRSDATTHR